MRTQRTFIYLTAAVASLALFAGSGPAVAQQTQEGAPPAAGASPAPGVNQGAPPAGQDQKEERAQQSQSGKMGREEPSSQIATEKGEQGPPLANGALAVPGAPADSQTVPAKFSPRNAALDALPIMAHPLPLDEAERVRLAKALKDADAPVAPVKLAPAQQVPLDVELHPLPADVASDNAVLSGLNYVRLDDRVLLVQPLDRIVVGEIAD